MLDVDFPSFSTVPMIPRSSSSPLISKRPSIDPAGLVRPEQHSPSLMRLLGTKPSLAIGYIVHYVSHIVQNYCIELPLSYWSRYRAISHASDFTSFVTRILEKAHVTMAVVLASLAYIDRLKSYLQVPCDAKYALERVFLGSVIVASKYLNDSSLQNIHWARITKLFGKDDVGRIEREFLNVLDFELRLTEDDLLAHHDSLVIYAFPKIPSDPLRGTPDKHSKTISFPSPVHQRLKTHSPALLPLAAHSSPSKSSSPLPATSCSLLEFDSPSSSDSDSSATSPLTPSGLSLDDHNSETVGKDLEGSEFWHTFFAALRIQEASSPIGIFQNR